MGGLKFPAFPVVALASFFLTSLSAMSQAWVQSSASVGEYWHSVASSADGTKLVAVSFDIDFSLDFLPPPTGGIYLSTNSGATWTLSPTAPTGGWICVSSSADGSKLAALDGGGLIYISTTAGKNWKATLTQPQFLDCIACSSVGNKLVAGAWNDFVGSPSLIYTSGTFGSRLRKSDSLSQYWTSLACSGDGKRLVASCVNASDTGGIYISRDFGETWHRSRAPAGNWYAVASSADGTKLAAAISGGPIYISTNSGAAWSAKIVPAAAWTSLAFSADGEKLVAVSNYGGPIFTSDDSGNSWTQADAPLKHWLSVASSADGNKVVAASFEDGIYTLQKTPTPQLVYGHTKRIMTISWTVPSALFVLQQSADSVNWENVTTRPILNLSKLIYQVTLPATPDNKNSVFRLLAQ
jgi:hypothetical protein